ncbi:hypothetical protein DKX38_023062 [Salix brachista]|uniref:Uncharacterized protein n=1 Tax=Salix brachista TaxID=2182728 RepID=A0A5N5K5S6_9ROSI|nr:hypothetical protein DKX38_023062 [Salix brachista]
MIFLGLDLSFLTTSPISARQNDFLTCLTSVYLQGASGIIFPIIKGEGVRQMFFPVMVPAYHRSPPVA